MITLASSQPKEESSRKQGTVKKWNSKWVYELWEPNKKLRFWLRTYPTTEMVAWTHDVAALALKGESSMTPCLNLTNSVGSLHVPIWKEADSGSIHLPPVLAFLFELRPNPSPDWKVEKCKFLFLFGYSIPKWGRDYLENNLVSVSKQSISTKILPYKCQRTKYVGNRYPPEPQRAL